MHEELLFYLVNTGTLRCELVKAVLKKKSLALQVKEEVCG